MILKHILKGKNILVTGGAGFIGSHLVEHLAVKNNVTILDDLSTGRIGNLKGFRNRTKFIEGSILDVTLLKKIMKDIEIVFHEAALPSVERSIRDPKTTHEIDATGTLNVLLAARDCAVGRVVYASSSSIYGDTPELPKNENMHLNPLSPYAVSKATGELYCKVFASVFGLNVVSVRYFNVFGARQDPNSQYAAVIPRFITLMMDGKRPLIFGDGTQTRDFTFIYNVIHGTELAAVSNGVSGEVLNIACGNQISVNALVKMLNDILAKDIEPIYKSQRPGDVKHSRADITKAQRLLGYKEVIGFEEGLRMTVEYFRKSH